VQCTPCLCSHTCEARSPGCWLQHIRAGVVEILAQRARACMHTHVRGPFCHPAQGSHSMPTWRMPSSWPAARV
jgi:hypothetical protein